MRSIAHHTTRYPAVATLAILMAVTAAAQTVPGIRIDNVGVVTFGYQDGSRDSLTSAPASIVVEDVDRSLALLKRASVDTVAPGQAFTYVLTVRNAGPATLTSISIVDTLDAATLVLASASTGTLTGPVLLYQRSSLAPGEMDSVVIHVRARNDVTEGTTLSNTAFGLSVETGSFVAVSRALVQVRQGGGSLTPRLAVIKIVSRDTVETGGLGTYTIRVRNEGIVQLSNVTIVDTLPPAVDPVLVSGGGAIIGRVTRSVQRSLANMPSGSEDSIVVTFRVRTDRPHGELVRNVVTAASDQTPVVQDSADFHVRAVSLEQSCRVTVTAAPFLVIGNGIAATQLRAAVTDTLGNPKPDGTPVDLRTTVGFFSNGLDSITVPLVGGVATDSLRALIVSSTIVPARVTASVHDAGTCQDSAHADIVFFPGAVAGIVIDNRTNEPVSGAFVQVYSSAGAIVGQATTGPDGTYVIPVPRTDDYQVTIQTTDSFGAPMNSVTTVSVSVPSIGGRAPVLTTIVISGKVYYLVSKKPVAAAGIKVILTQLPGGGSAADDGILRTGRLMVDSTFTDTTGSYTFSGLPSGNTYAVSIDDAFLRGSVAVAPLEPGKYVTNVNIPITLNANLDLVKSGPARAFRRDTVSYTIDLRNRGNLSTTSSVVADSLDRSMRFVSAAPAPTSVDTGAGVIRWNIGRLDSAASPASHQVMTVVVRYLDTTDIDRVLTNTASFSSEQTTDTSVTVTTKLFETELAITKTAARPIVEIGDQAIYTLNVRNATPSMLVQNVIVEDRPPLGFTYLAGSSFRDTTRLPDPTIMRVNGGVLLRWQLADSLLSGVATTLSYRMIVGSGGAEGDGINRAMALASAPNGAPIRSSEAEVRVEVQRGVFTDRGLLVGKVFYDANLNSYQDPTEKGLKGVELITEDGTRVVTGDDGKYSIPDIAPGEHVVRIRQHTLPEGATLHVGFNDFAGEPASRFAHVPAGGIARADFYLDAPPVDDTLITAQHVVRVGGLSVRRVVAPRNVVFIDDERPALMKLTGLNFEVGKAVLRPEAYPIIHELANILRDDPDEHVTIMGHTDSSPIRTKEFPDNRVLSIARAEAVKAYLVDHEGIDLLRIATAGYGETVPVADNKSREGRTLNRRIEFGFGPIAAASRSRDSVAIVVRVPVAYEGSTDIKRVEWTDSLDAGLRYVQGTATMSGRSIEPSIHGGLLGWTIDSVSGPFHGTLIYQMMTARPDARVKILNSRTFGIRVVTADSVYELMDVLSTSNQIAAAIPGSAVNFVMPSALYETAQASLRPGAESALEATASMLRLDPTLSLIVEGHTDSRPIRTVQFPSNQDLSQARAQSIVDLLAARFKIGRSRMEALGYGEHRPIATNGTFEGRQRNRRVEARLFRSEFWRSVLKEGGVDSTRDALTHVAPMVDGSSDTSVTLRAGDRYLLAFEATWADAGTRPSFIAIADTLPSWMSVDHTSIRSEGVDSIAIGSPLFARGIPLQPQLRVAFQFVVREAVPVGTLVRHRFFTVRRLQNGTEIVSESTPLLMKLIR